MLRLDFWCMQILDKRAQMMLRAWLIEVVTAPLLSLPISGVGTHFDYVPAEIEDKVSYVIPLPTMNIRLRVDLRGKEEADRRLRL